MMKFGADFSHLDIECWILDIHQRFRVQGKMVLPQNHFVQNELPQFIFIATTHTHCRIRDALACQTGDGRAELLLCTPLAKQAFLQ